MTERSQEAPAETLVPGDVVRRGHRLFTVHQSSVSIGGGSPPVCEHTMRRVVSGVPLEIETQIFAFGEIIRRILP